ncbi:hypothetical protein ACFL6S_23330 [Candidatus Poribacteria bacterium]
MISFPHEQELMEDIDRIESNMRISPSAGLLPTDIRETVKKLIESTKQRTRVSDIYLDMIRNLNCAPYLTRLNSSPPFSDQPISNPLISCSDTDYQIAVTPENNEAFCSFLCLIVDGFFSNLIGASDSFAKIVNILYNCINSMDNIYLHKVRDRLVSRIPRGRLTVTIKTFHPRNPSGSIFNVAKDIRNELTHDILDVMDFPPLHAMYGRLPESALRFHFKERFFQSLVSSRVDRELTRFCTAAHEELAGFIDGAYGMMLNKLNTTGQIPV